MEDNEITLEDFNAVLVRRLKMEAANIEFNDAAELPLYTPTVLGSLTGLEYEDLE